MSKFRHLGVQHGGEGEPGPEDQQQEHVPGEKVLRRAIEEQTPGEGWNRYYLRHRKGACHPPGKPVRIEKRHEGPHQGAKKRRNETARRPPYTPHKDKNVAYPPHASS